MSNKHEYYKLSYDELELIFDLSFDLITITDEKGIYLKVSKSCEPFFGVKEEDMVGVSALMFEKQGIFDKSTTAEVIRTNKKVTLIQKTKTNKIMVVTGFPVFDEYGKLAKIINISKDITENQKLSEKLENAQDELRWVKNELYRRNSINDIKKNIHSPAMGRIMSLIYQISDIDATVLLLGETGVGKGYFAKVIHESSTRKDKPLISINCGAIPENLLESELFGYEGGAFTGANREGKKGLFEIAGEGTIFLDEIGDMPMNLQVKLLQVLDQKSVIRIGGQKPIKLRGRIIAATNKDLLNLIKEGKFREDLYYRLNVVPITIPPLRQRREDIIGLINQFLNKYNLEHKTNKIITQGGYNMLMNYNYPGNIRELQNIVERLIITTYEDIIEDTQILEIIEPKSGVSYFEDYDGVTLREAVEQLERKILIEAFKKHSTTREVANVLGIDQSTVVKKAKKLKIK